MDAGTLRSGNKVEMIPGNKEHILLWTYLAAGKRKPPALFSHLSCIEIEREWSWAGWMIISRWSLPQCCQKQIFLKGMQRSERVCAWTCSHIMLTWTVCKELVKVLNTPQQPCCTCSMAAWNTAELHLVLIWTRGLVGLPPSQAQWEPLTTWQCLKLTAAVSAHVTEWCRGSAKVYMETRCAGCRDVRRNREFYSNFVYI